MSRTYATPKIVLTDALKALRNLRAHDEEPHPEYCRHGTYVGCWWGPDYLCGACEMDIDDRRWALNIGWDNYRAGRKYVASRLLEALKPDRVDTSVKTLAEYLTTDEIGEIVDLYARLTTLKFDADAYKRATARA